MGFICDCFMLSDSFVLLNNTRTQSIVKRRLMYTNTRGVCTHARCLNRTSSIIRHVTRTKVQIVKIFPGAPSVEAKKLFASFTVTTAGDTS